MASCFISLGVKSVNSASLWEEGSSRHLFADLCVCVCVCVCVYMCVSDVVHIFSSYVLWCLLLQRNDLFSQLVHSFIHSFLLSLCI